MKPEDEKIPGIFKAPDGYFDEFESKLRARMNSPQPKQSGELHVTHRRPSLNIEWVAAAAAGVCLFITAWFIFKPNREVITQDIAVKPKHREMAPVHTPPIDSAQVVQNENALIATFEEEDITDAPTTPEIIAPVENNDQRIAQELEDAGLIVQNIEDGLFDEIELAP